jgi:uncharacterized glyoxalase superfamily protein PhnB
MIMPIFAVRDFDASLAFYTEKLGFTQDMVLQDANGNNTFGFVRLGKAIVGLSLDTEQQQGVHPAPGVQFMVYLPDEIDIDRHHADVTARGVTADAVKTEYWGDRIFSVHDPDGYWLTFATTVQQVPMDKIEAIVRGDVPRE